MTGNKITLCLVFFSLGVVMAKGLPDLADYWRSRDRFGVTLAALNVAAVVGACIMAMVYL